jgi:hypothetical protein
MKKFIPDELRGKDKIRITKTYLYISVKARNRINYLGNLDVYYDKDKKVVKLVKNKNGLLSLKKNGQINGMFSKVLPLGNYLYDKEGGVYKYLSL